MNAKESIPPYAQKSEGIIRNPRRINRKRVYLAVAILVAVLSILPYAYEWLKPTPIRPTHTGVEFVFTDKREGDTHQHEVIYPIDSFEANFSDSRDDWQRWRGSMEFIGTSSHGDVYVLDLEAPTGAHVVSTVLYVGEPIIVSNTAAECVELRPLAINNLESTR